jgi:hypothetical protein
MSAREAFGVATPISAAARSWLFPGIQAHQILWESSSLEQSLAAGRRA